MIWVALGSVALVTVCFVEWWTARYLASDPTPRREPCSLDCRDGVPDENCTGSRHLTREEVEFIQSLDGQLGIKP